MRRGFTIPAACGVALALSGALPGHSLARDGVAAASRGQGDDDSEGIPLRFDLSGSVGGTGTNSRPRVTGSFRPAGGVPHMPVIDPSVVAGAIALAAGGLLILRDHRRRRR
jgi:hypothetical protein